MADKTGIEWTDATWTPIRARNLVTGKVGWHCEHASPGCAHCYSESFNERRLGTGLPFKPGHRGDVEHFLDEAMLLAPLRWRKPRRIFVCSMTDLFGDWVPDAWIDRVFAVMALARQHTYQVLTKRSDRMRAYLSDPNVHERVTLAASDVAPSTLSDSGYAKVTVTGVLCRPSGPWPLPNVWLGVSAEDQRRADERVPDLLATPAAVRFVSAEPLLSGIDFTRIACPNGCEPPDYCNRCYPDGRKPTGTFDALSSGDLDWIIVGGESGPSARPMHPTWARDIRDQCAAAGVSFHFKQWGEFRPLGSIHDLDDAISTALMDADEARSLILCSDGTIWPDEHGQPPANAWMMERVGKARAGRLLDGVEHNGMPAVPA